MITEINYFSRLYNVFQENPAQYATEWSVHIKKTYSITSLHIVTKYKNVSSPQTMCWLIWTLERMVLSIGY